MTRLLLNWHFWACIAIGTAGALALFAESTSTLTLIATKIVAAALLYAFWRLFAYWDEKGKFPEWDKITEDM